MEIKNELLLPEKKSVKKRTPKIGIDSKERDFIEILKMFAPGTSLRMGLDDIIRMGKGALIVFDSENLPEIIEIGFKVNSKFSPQKLVELAKMDGAIILSKDLKKILYANAFLFPSIQVLTKETGTRHKAAERTAKQLNTITIAVSERKNKITIYHKDTKYELGESSEILRRATETLQILEKQKEMLNNLIVNLNISEITNLVTMTDVCNVLQRIEIIRRISEIVKRYLIELGSEGTIVSMRLRELTKNLNKERTMILKDYFKSTHSRSDLILRNINFDRLLEISEISKALFGEFHEESLFPKGIRILSESNLSEKNVKLLMNNFKSLNEIFNANKDSLIKVLKDEKVANSLKQTLENLGEKILSKRKF